MTDTATDTPPPKADAPVPFMRGVFALYDTPDGGIHLAFRPDDASEDQHQQIPAHIVNLARAAMENGGSLGPMEMISALRGKNKPRG